MRLEAHIDAPARADVLERRPFDVEEFAARHTGVTLFRPKIGALLFTQGERASCVYYIHRGRVRITVVSPRGKEAIVAVIDPGDFCGEACLIGERLRPATATCIADSVVARLDQSSVLRALHQDQAFADVFVAHIVTNVVQLRETVLSHLIDGAEVRLARVLLQLAKYGTHSQKGIAITHVDQEALAQMVGTTRSRINYFMNKFRNLGHIHYNGIIVVHKSILSVVRGDE